MDTATHEWFRIRPFYTQHLLWSVEMQGKLLRVKASPREKQHRPHYKRNVVSEFSRKARMRMCRYSARVDWQHENRGVFITLTYPDERVEHLPRSRSIHLHTFHRYAEKYLDREIPLMWRVEWVQRKSGVNIGSFAPHFHGIFPDVAYLPMDDVNRWWRDSIRHDGYCRTEVKRLATEEVHAIYLSKYMAKVAESSSLVNVPYLSKGGRHYGYLRKHLIPLCPEKHFLDCPDSCIPFLQSLGSLAWSTYDRTLDKGFTLLGRNATDFQARVEERLLDAGMVAA